MGLKHGYTRSPGARLHSRPIKSASLVVGFRNRVFQGKSLLVQWLGLGVFTAGAQGVESLVRELRFHKPQCGVCVCVCVCVCIYIYIYLIYVYMPHIYICVIYISHTHIQHIYVYTCGI